MTMRNRKQNGTIIRIGSRWYVRYWERRSIGGSIERKRVTHSLGEVMTRGKRATCGNQVRGRATHGSHQQRHGSCRSSSRAWPPLVAPRVRHRV